MDLALTLFTLAGGVGLVCLTSWLEHRPRTNLKPRLIPTTWLMFAGALVALLATVHLMTIFGVASPGR